MKTSKQARSIRIRLLILAVVAIAPLAVQRAFDIESERRDSLEDARQNAFSLAQRGADRQNEALGTARGALQLIARSYSKVVESGVPCGEFLKAAATDLRGIKTISVVNASGRVVCSATPGSVGLDVSDRPYFKTILETGGFAVSDYSLGRRIQGPTVFVGYGPRGPTGSVDTVFVALLDLEWIGQIAADIAKRAGSVVLMVDGRGTVLTRYPNPDDWTGKRFADHPLVRHLLSAPEGIVAAKGIDGIPRIFGFTRLHGTNAHFAIGLDEADILHRVNGAMMRSFIQLGLVSVLVFFGIWYGGERLFVRPIRALAQTATRIGNGQLDARAMQETLAAEFMPLAAAMNDMAGRLAAREDEMRASNEKLESLVILDPLSGLANRRGFDARLQEAWRLSAFHQRPVGLLMIDIDHFKRFNDTYGHVKGDACLRAVAEVVSTGADEPEGLAARYGGEEFAVLLPGVDENEAIAIAERLRASVEALGIPHNGSPARRVTVSVGAVSLIGSETMDADVLVKTADVALYAAKSHGRNRVVRLPSASDLSLAG